MRKLKWRIYKDFDEFRFDKNLSNINCGVYVIWSYVQDSIKILYTGQDDIKNRLYCHNSQTDWGDYFPLSAA